VSKPHWHDIAAWYDEIVRTGRTPHALAVRTTLELAGDVAGRRVLDVACGQGIATRALAGAGAASVVGLDITAELLDAARSTEVAEPLGITYVRDDAQRMDEIGDESVNVVTCQLALMDIPELDATLNAVARVLVPGGVFAAVISHPCFLAPFAATGSTAEGEPARVVGRYLTEGFWRSPNPDGVRRVGHWSRTLSTYLNAFVTAGFVLERFTEPRATGAYAEDQPVYREVPVLLGIRARRGATSAAA
jgi:ubiquinone/menaquinone biosynthesis C-methylase UbiE